MDMNYYYPSSTGHGIDTYFIDSGIIVHPDYFDTYNEIIQNMVLLFYLLVVDLL